MLRCLCFIYLFTPFRYCSTPSDAPGRSLQLVGPPVPSLLVLLHSFPLCRVLVGQSRRCPDRDFLCFLATFGGLAAKVLRRRIEISLRSFRYRRFGPRSPRLGCALLFLGIRGKRFRSYQRASSVIFAIWSFGFFLLAFFLPNAIAELLHAVQVGVVQEREEIAIPHPVLGGGAHAAGHAGEAR